MKDLEKKELTMCEELEEAFDSGIMDLYYKFKTEILGVVYNPIMGKVTTAKDFIKELMDVTGIQDTSYIPLKTIETILDDSNDLRANVITAGPNYDLFIVCLRDKCVKDNFYGNGAFVRMETTDNESGNKRRASVILIDEITQFDALTPVSPSIEAGKDFVIKHEIVHMVIDFMVFNQILPEQFDANGVECRDDLEYLADFIPIYAIHGDDKIAIDIFVEFIQSRFKNDVQLKYKPFIKETIMYFNTYRV